MLQDNEVLEKSAETDAVGVVPQVLAVRQLNLTNFRSYPSLHLSLSASPVILTGANGAGKTNILEALSFLSPGRGLRGSKLTEVDCCSGAVSLQVPWAVSATIEGTSGACQVGTGRDPSGSSDRAKRVVRIDGQPMRGQAELANVFSVIWLTPAMDQLFQAASSDRRRFLDRLVYNFDPVHAQRVAKYEYVMRERAKLLQQPRKDEGWLKTLEQKMAESAVSIAAARLEAVEVLQQAILRATTSFPKAYLALDGTLETWLQQMPALHAEERYSEGLYKNREMDAYSGRTNLGPHRTDLAVTHVAKAMPAALCSTGEQKALLLAIILAEARARAEWKGTVPVLLLDEVVAHLDANRRESLFSELQELRTQAWLTGTDALLFEGFQGEVQHLTVNQGKVTYLP